MVFGSVLMLRRKSTAAARVAGIRRAEPAMLHGALAWVVAVPPSAAGSPADAPRPGEPRRGHTSRISRLGVIPLASPPHAGHNARRTTER